MTDNYGSKLEGNIDIPEVDQNFKGMSISLSNVNAREWFTKTREGVKPWAEFFNFNKFKVPKSVAPVPKRVVRNIEQFQSNYMFVFGGLIVFCILTSPLLLVAIAVCLGACYIISLKNQERKVRILGKELSLVQQYAAVGLCSFPIFWLAGAGSAVFWVIGASFFIIMLHASMYITAEEAEVIELEMEEV
ncbi:prenylated Rab acceptor protein 1-like isoform X2 [Saccostrea echinata]|uniref:prenylated Rab acceptor protein 1-like isoform X2 n=1 Tax=Saccostrea echinata TaxID=191078 RepID=UPI002A81B315|nr:prenylated Rab acceptor protein 1-like isoform X2 [Saccostrea echinata]